jgi:predicted AAA+ superfamily ATPase
MSTNKLLKSRWQENAFRGFYPEIITRKIKPDVWYAAYTKTYIERDVRQIKNIENLSLFIKFLHLCAGRAAQIVNINALANDCGIDNKTAQSWLGILESSFITYQLKPYFKNFNKQVTKSSKLYFHDTGLLCHLLHISNSKVLLNSLYKGPVFENFIISEKIKQKENAGLNRDFFFWRDKTGNEVDLIIDNHKSITIAEIKSAETITASFWKTLYYFENLYGKQLEKELYYGGNENQRRTGKLQITGWLYIIEENRK